MRTTVTLDADTQALVQRRMREHGISFKEALNDAIRTGLGGHDTQAIPFKTRPADLGIPAVSLDKALQLVAELEDEELVRRMRLGK